MSFQFYALGNNKPEAAKVITEALEKDAMAKGMYDESDLLRNPQAYTGLNWDEAKEHLLGSGKYKVLQ